MQVSQNNVRKFLEKKGVQLQVCASKWYILYSRHLGYTYEGVTYCEWYTTIIVQAASEARGVLAELVFTTARGGQPPLLKVYG